MTLNADRDRNTTSIPRTVVNRLYENTSTFISVILQAVVGLCDDKSMRAHLQGNVPVLFARSVFLLADVHLQRADQLDTGVLGLDHIVH